MMRNVPISRGLEMRRENNQSEIWERSVRKGF
jgi:hypothetical protein